MGRSDRPVAPDPTGERPRAAGSVGRVTAPADVRTCYRHPDRVAGIACQRCDRPICPACMHQASVGFHCPECARAGRQVEHRGIASLRTRPVATQVLIGINVAVFALGLLLGGAGGLTGRGGSTLVSDGALWAPIVPDEPWRLLTSGFLHAGLIHVGLNMWVLWVLGQILEPVLGRARFLALYLASLAGGSLGVVLVDVVLQTPWREIPVTVGASGAIYGLMGGAVVLARTRTTNLAQSGILTILGLNLFLTFAIPGISIGGHLGGLVGGLVAGLVVVEVAPRLGKAGPAVTAALSCLLAGGFLLTAYLLSDLTRTNI